MSRGTFPVSEFPVVTKNQIKMMYFLGLILSKVISKSRIQSIIGKYQFNNQEIQKEISTVIEKNLILNAEITQLKDSDCDCGNERVTGLWKFPVICMGLYFIFLFFIVLYLFGIRIAEVFVQFIGQIGINLECFWIPFP